MIEEIRKAFATGLGAVLLTKDKIEEMTRKWVEEAKISKEDAQKLQKELLEAGENQYSKFEKSVQDSMKKAYENLGVVRNDDYLKLKQRLEALEIRVSVLEKTEKETKE